MDEPQKIKAKIQEGLEVEFESADDALLFISHFAQFPQFVAYHFKLKGGTPPNGLYRQLRAKTDEFKKLAETLKLTDGTPFSAVWRKP